MGHRGTLAELEAALAGDAPALERLIARLTPAIQARVARVLLLRHTGHGSIRQDVEDLTQEVLMLLFADDGRVLRRWDPDRGLTLERFAALVTGRRVSSMLRSGRRNPWRERPTEPERLDDVSRDAGPEAAAASRHLLDRLLERLEEALSPFGWQVFELLFVRQLSVAETMAETSLSADAVYAWRSRLRRRARSLAQELERPAPGTGARTPQETRYDVR